MMSLVLFSLGLHKSMSSSRLAILHEIGESASQKIYSVDQSGSLEMESGNGCSYVGLPVTETHRVGKKWRRFATTVQFSHVLVT
jgi:hypothetical protein